MCVSAGEALGVDADPARWFWEWECAGEEVAVLLLLLLLLLVEVALEAFVTLAGSILGVGGTDGTLAVVLTLAALAAAALLL